MSTVRRILDLDPDTNARIDALAIQEGKDAAAVVGDAVALLEAALDTAGLDTAGLDIAEDLRRLDHFERTGEAVPWEEVKAWVESWGSAKELPRPEPRKMR